MGLTFLCVTGQSFCTGCITQAVELNNSCPLCRGSPVTFRQAASSSTEAAASSSAPTSENLPREDDTSPAAQHDVHTAIQMLMAQVSSLGDRSAGWDAQLSELQHLDVQLSFQHQDGGADSWQSYGDLDAYLAQVTADLADYTVQHGTRDSQDHGLESVQWPASEHQQIEQEHHSDGQQHEYESDVTTLMEALHVQRQYDHQRCLADALGLAPEVLQLLTLLQDL